MTVNMSGLRDGKAWPAFGETLVVPDEEGAQLCASRVAEPVAESRKAEKATPRKRAEKRAN